MLLAATEHLNAHDSRGLLNATSQQVLRHKTGEPVTEGEIVSIRYVGRGRYLSCPRDLAQSGFTLWPQSSRP
jgi:hypothetical protein